MSDSIIKELKKTNKELRMINEYSRATDDNMYKINKKMENSTVMTFIIILFLAVILITLITIATHQLSQPQENTPEPINEQFTVQATTDNCNTLLNNSEKNVVKCLCDKDPLQTGDTITLKKYVLSPCYDWKMTKRG